MFSFSIGSPDTTPNTFRTRLKTFLENTTVHCYRYLVEDHRSKWEIFLWIIVHAIFAFCSVTIVINSWIGFTENPLMTKLHTTLYPSSKVAFPGIAICNVNRISRRAAVRFAEELRAKDKHPEMKRDTQFYLKQIKLLASMYTYDYVNEIDLIEFQRILDEVYEESELTLMNDIMNRLTPRCEDMLLRCFWQSKEVKCIGGPFALFESRRTEYGICCSFNYIIKPNNVVGNSRKATFTGPEMGLFVLVHGQPEDYFYQMASTRGFIVLVHNAFDFPDIPSGNVNQVHVRLGKETHIRVDSHYIFPDEFIENYKPATRKCIFPKEMGTKYGGTYAKSQCISYCRIQSILALCDCVPFSLPADLFYNKTDSLQICNLNHVPCLNRYRIKWLTISTETLYVKGLEREREESLLCEDCLPCCFDNKYRATYSSLPLHVSKRKGTHIMESVKNVSQTALIRVFFGSPNTWAYMQTVQMTWFEIISNFGGIFGVLLGFSMLSLIEIIYFVVREIYYWLVEKWHHHRLHETITEHGGMVIVP
ncbi:pickpocket protein 28-like [Culicoides brevitarsis]|uniref:pickpocket protein 28-like n=1 Tax=Culicoides brevitarsis TaxID=469753 RepID=UPI00307C4AB2